MTELHRFSTPAGLLLNVEQFTPHIIGHRYEWATMTARPQSRAVYDCSLDKRQQVPHRLTPPSQQPLKRILARSSLAELKVPKGKARPTYEKTAYASRASGYLNFKICVT